MGRQPKQGLDFWLRDVGLFRDPKLRRPRQMFGYLALVVYEGLIDILYGDKGYYIDCRGDAWDNLLWQLSEPVQGKYAPTIETLADVVDSLVACELFSGDLYRHGFITSKRAQKNFFSATLGRAAPQINFDIWLLSESDMRELNPSGKSFVLQSFISWQEKRVSWREISVSQPESTQSRGEESRVENSRVEHRREEESKALPGADLTDLIREIENLIDGKIDTGFRSEINRLLSDGMDRAVILGAAAKTADKHPADPPPYLRRILQGYERSGIWTESDVRRADKPRSAAPASHDPAGPLTDWEQDWLAKIEARKAGRTNHEKI